MTIDPNTIKDWLIPVASFIGIISTSVGIWLALKEYRVKLIAEKRLSESSRAETDIRLLSHFTNILELASGRRTDRDIVYSKEVAEKLLETLDIDPNKEDFDFIALMFKFAKATLLEPPVGGVSQKTAIMSITTLAKRHDVLIAPAIQALEALHYRNPEIIEKCLNELKDLNKESHNK